MEGSHETNRLYPTVEVEDPVSWFVKRYGVVATTLGPRATSRAGRSPVDGPR